MGVYLENPFIDFSQYLYPDERISLIYNIPGLIDVYPNYYITSKGRVFSSSGWRSTEPVREMVPMTNNTGYLQINLPGPNGYMHLRINRLVMIYFGGPIPQNVRLLEVNHKDRNHLNNDISNLEWVTHKDNMEHMGNTGGSTSNMTQETVEHIIDDLNTNRYNIREIADRNGVNESAVKHIKDGSTFKYVKPDDRHWEMRKFLSKTDYVNIYNLAKKGMPYGEIAKLYDKSKVTIEAICSIRPPYDKYLGHLPPIVKMGPKCDDKTALAVYNDCKENKLTVKQICNKYGLGESLVADIKFLRHSYEPLREKYGLEPLDVNPHGTGHTIPDDIRAQIIQELKNGAKPSEIAQKYHYSESIIYRIRRNNL